MKKLLIVLFVGLIAGILDLIPLFLVNAPLFNMLSVMAFWLVAAYIISKTTMLRNSIMNGLVISTLLMIPMALAVSATNPKDFIPMMFMSLLLGPFVGFVIGKFTNKTNA